MKSMEKYLRHLLKDSIFWISGFIYLQLFRLIFILFFSGELSKDVPFIDFYLVFLNGAKFDSSTISYFLIIPFFSTASLFLYKNEERLNKIRIFFISLFVIISSTLFIVSIGYFVEYNDQFNHFLFVGLYDDQYAVLMTMIYEFHLIEAIILLTVLIIYIKRFFLFLVKFNIQINIKLEPIVKYRFVLFILVFGLFICGLRGSFGKRPALRKWANISTDDFLNKIVMNPFISLKYAYKDFKSLNNSKTNPYLKNETILNALTKYYGKSDSLDIFSYIKKKNDGDFNLKNTPKTIFLIVMESYDSWPLDEKYASLNISNELKSIAKKGVHFTHFLPSAYSTMNSFSSILTGIPYTGINISRNRHSDISEMSLPSQLKTLGYRVNFFYGGFSSWQNIGNMTKELGVDNVYSAPHMGFDESEKGVWGVDDKRLFDFSLSKVDTTIKTLNIILTTSYHPPYNMDVYTKGFPLKKIPDDLKHVYDGSISLKRLGHLWYADKSIGEFVKKAENKFKSNLFLFTGDHYGRKFLNNKPNLVEKSHVPFIIYGTGVRSEINKTPGSHIDILPTLINMISEKNNIFYSFGTDLFSNNKRAYGKDKILTSDKLYSFKKNIIDSMKLTQRDSNQSFRKLKSDYNNLMGISLHLIKNGAKIR